MVHLPATKNGSAGDVPLSSVAVSVLQALMDAQDANVKGCGRVFDMLHRLVESAARSS